jgi:hypothetical protein
MQPRDQVRFDLVGAGIREPAAQVLPHDLLARCEQIERETVSLRDRCRVGHGMKNTR